MIHNQSLQQGQDESAPAPEPPATPAEPEFVKDDPSNWSEHLRLTYVKKKGKKREPVGYALPSGVQAIAGEGDCPMHDKSGFEFYYSKDVKTGIKARRRSTSTTEDPDGDLLPEEEEAPAQVRTPLPPSRLETLPMTENDDEDDERQ